MLQQSTVLAMIIALGLGVWIASSEFSAAVNDPDPLTVAESQQGPTPVQVRQQQAESIAREITIQGQVEPNRVVVLKAQIGGQVDQVLVDKGQSVAAAQPIIEISVDDREARLMEVKALVEQRQADFNAMKRMADQGCQSQTQLNQAAADLERARAQLKTVELELADRLVRTPFAGIVNDRYVELGDVVEPNMAVAELVDNSVLLVSAQVPQQNIAQLQRGGSATVHLATGETVTGTIRYIAARAESTTRTFRVEVEIPNDNNRLMSGVSGELVIPVETVASHFLSPALLTLDSEGILGVKTVGEDNRVVFHPVQVVRSSSDGVWVAGLPDTAQLITVGQGFVAPGERVKAVPETVPQLAIEGDEMAPAPKIGG